MNNDILWNINDPYNVQSHIKGGAPGQSGWSGHGLTTSSAKLTHAQNVYLTSISQILLPSLFRRLQLDNCVLWLLTQVYINLCESITMVSAVRGNSGRGLKFSRTYIKPDHQKCASFAPAHAPLLLIA